MDIMRSSQSATLVCAAGPGGGPICALPRPHISCAIRAADGCALCKAQISAEQLCKLTIAVSAEQPNQQVVRGMLLYRKEAQMCMSSIFCSDVCRLIGL